MDPRDSGISLSIRRVHYVHTMLEVRPGEAYRLLSELLGRRVNLLAFSAIPMDAEHTQLALFPESLEALARAAEKTGIVLTGPQRAFLIQGDDQLGVFAEIHGRLYEANVNVYASSGITDGRGGYGYVLYVKSADFVTAARALGCLGCE